MRARVTAIGLLVGEGSAQVDGFQPRRHLPERKHLKFMSRAVRLGVATVRQALAGRPEWEAVPPERRGLFVGATPAGADADALKRAVEASSPDGVFDEVLFGLSGLPRVPPLWLVKGLSNNILGLASMYCDIRGVNGNRCEGRVGGLAAVVDGARAIDEGRADLVVAGGADSLVGADGLLGHPGGEGAAFLVLEREGDGPCLVGGGVVSAPDLERAPIQVDLGAATGPIELARRLLDGERAFRVEVDDPFGMRAWVEVG